MNDPPTALVGFGEEPRASLSRLSMNNPPTALVGFGEDPRASLCRLSMADPPTALVGLVKAVGIPEGSLMQLS